MLQDVANSLLVGYSQLKNKNKTEINLTVWTLRHLKVGAGKGSVPQLTI